MADKMSMCTCMVQLLNDSRTVIYRGPTKPVSWPEIEVLMELHGEHAVTEIEVIEDADANPVDEVKRLAYRYGGDLVKTLFPGRRPSIELIAPRSIKRAAGVKAPAAPKRASKSKPEPVVEDDPLASE